MSDPKRWLDEDGGATSEERELLQSGREARMPSPLRERVWLGIAGSAAGMGAAAGAAASALPKGAAIKGAVSLLSSSAAKSVIVLAVLGTVGAGVVALRSSSVGVHAQGSGPFDTTAATVPRNAPAVRTSSPAVLDPIHEERSLPANPLPGARVRAIDSTRSLARSSARTSAPSSPSTVAAPATATPAEDTEPRASEHASEIPSPSRLREESARVVAIREKLLSGNPAEALRMLDRAHADFPGGTLAQEREALAVRALSESGQKEAARKRGEAFLRAFPRSPHAAEVRALLGP